MPFLDTGFDGLLVFEPQVWGDERGYFFEAFNQKTFLQAGIDRSFVQDNQAKSVFGVIRGLHYQLPPFEQAKLVRVLEGAVMDVVVDLRKEKATYGKVFNIMLSGENKKQLYVPRGFAHGYAVLSETAEFFYKCDNYYSKAHEGGIRFNDPALQIDWGIITEEATASEKDKTLPLFGQHKTKI